VSDKTNVRAAIVPAAGLGTRLHPLTLGTAKELLPLGANPALTASFLEAHAAALSELVVVTAPEKEGIARFVKQSPLAKNLGLRVAVTEQPEPLGVLDAVARGRALLTRSDGSDESALPCAVLFPDLLHLPDQTALKTLCAAHSECGAAVIGLRTSPPGDHSSPTTAVRLADPLTTRTAIEAAQKSGRPLRIAGLSRPSAEPLELRTTFAQIETVAFVRAVDKHCRKQPGAALDDRGLLAALCELAEAGQLYGVLLPGEIVDLGNLRSYVATAARFFTGACRLAIPSEAERRETP
jgi:UTP-glucose-1-phosphate uridylyltransferase